MKRNNFSRQIVKQNIEDIKRMYNEGLGVCKISKQFGISESSLRINMIREGVEFRKKTKTKININDEHKYRILSDEEMDKEMKTILFPNGFK